MLKNIIKLLLLVITYCIYSPSASATPVFDVKLSKACGEDLTAQNISFKFHKSVKALSVEQNEMYYFMKFKVDGVGYEDVETFSNVTFTLFNKEKKITDISYLYPGTMEPKIQWFILKKESEDLAAATKKPSSIILLKASRNTVDSASCFKG